MEQGGILLCVSSFSGNPGESHALLRAAAERYMGHSGDWTIFRQPKGKPTFQTLPQVHFSITHSGTYWMCSLSDRNIGVDLQIHQPCDREKLSAQFFHPAEDAFLRQGGYADFFDLWTAKESYLKYTGQGITEGLDYFSVVAPDGRFPSMAEVWLHLMPWTEGYSLCLCARHPAAVTVVSL